jgi:hypothetical protein
LHSFVYEEFHPNHHVDIGRIAQEFLTHWFEKGFDENSTEFTNQFMTADGRIFSREEVLLRLRNCLNSYHKFFNIKFKGSDIGFEWDEKEAKGLGHAEGMFNYDAKLKMAKLSTLMGHSNYMSNDDGYYDFISFFQDFPVKRGINIHLKYLFLNGNNFSAALLLSSSPHQCLFRHHYQVTFLPVSHTCSV